MKRSGPLRRTRPLRSNAASQAAWEKRTREKLRADEPKPKPSGKRPARKTENPDYPEIVAFVRDRAGGRCEANIEGVCRPGPHRGHHAHHVQLRAQGGEDAAYNLLFVCLYAHEWIHAHPTESKQRGFIRGRVAP